MAWPYALGCFISALFGYTGNKRVKMGHSLQQCSAGLASLISDPVSSTCHSLEYRRNIVYTHDLVYGASNNTCSILVCRLCKLDPAHTCNIYTISGTSQRRRKKNRSATGSSSTNGTKTTVSANEPSQLVGQSMLTYRVGYSL